MSSAKFHKWLKEKEAAKEEVGPYFELKIMKVVIMGESAKESLEQSSQAEALALRVLAIPGAICLEAIAYFFLLQGQVVSKFVREVRNLNEFEFRIFV